MHPAGSLTSVSSYEPPNQHTNSTAENTNRKQEDKDANILAKLITNDIDETNINDKIARAQNVLEAHRESIKELLKTAAHTPNKLTYQPAETTMSDHNDRNDANYANRYNKMPNVTTRRVVFVNLDEDS